MMKKHDEGYVLAFVMVVIAVLCLVAVSLLSISLQNVQAQTASIERMKDKYVAMGQIEIVNAILTSPVIQTDKIKAVDAVKYALGTTGIAVEIKSKDGNTDEENKTVDFTSFTAEVAITAEHGETQIHCTYTWEGNLDKPEADGTYSITTTQLNCTSYEIRTGGDQ